MAYADYDYYVNTYGGTVLTDEDTANVALTKSSDTIDALTYCRITAAGGIDELTEFQQEVIRDVCCKLADWQTENSEYLDSPLSSYTINGVSVNFSGSSVTEVLGIKIPAVLYAKLKSTNLCWAVV